MTAPVVHLADLPARGGQRPRTTRATPHRQVSQTAPVTLQDELMRRAATLPGVRLGETLVSVPGARALHLAEELARGPTEAFQRWPEFAHMHPAHDGSLHLTLPPAVRAAVLAKGWGEPHPVSGAVLAYGPRDRDELEVVWALLVASYRYACGLPTTT